MHKYKKNVMYYISANFLKTFNKFEQKSYLKFFKLKIHRVQNYGKNTKYDKKEHWIFEKIVLLSYDKHI